MKGEPYYKRQLQSSLMRFRVICVMFPSAASATDREADGKLDESNSDSTQIGRKP